MRYLGLFPWYMFFLLSPALAGRLMDHSFNLSASEMAAIRHKSFVHKEMREPSVNNLMLLMDRVNRKKRRLRRAGKVSREQVFKKIQKNLREVVAKKLDTRRRQAMGFVGLPNFDTADGITLEDCQRIKRTICLQKRLRGFKSISNAGDFVGIPHKYHRRAFSRVGVLERDGVSQHRDLQACQVHESCLVDDGGHGAMVTSLLQQVHPGDVPVVNWDLTESSVAFLRKHHADIINGSFGFSNPKSIKSGVEKLSQLLPKEGLFIWAAGNHTQGIDAFGEVGLLLSCGHKNFLSVGNLRQDFSMAPSSNRAGQDPRLYEHFICAIGSGMIAGTCQGKYKIFSDGGTSSAAPVVTGLMGRLHEDFPVLDMMTLRLAVVETAHKDFFIGSGYKGVFMHHHKSLPNVSHDWSIYQVSQKPFDPTIYGAGILNGRGAYYVCQYLTENGGSVGDAVMAYRVFEMHQEEEAATIIQRRFRGYQKKKCEYTMKAWEGFQNVLWEKRQAYWLVRLGVSQQFKSFQYLLKKYYYNRKFVKIFVEEFLARNFTIDSKALYKKLVRYLSRPQEFA